MEKKTSNRMGGKLLADDGAVSPVIGVVLMIAITVILAATTAAFVFDLGEGTDNAPPQADFTYEYDTSGDGELAMMYEGGDTLDPSTVRIKSASGTFCPAPGNASSSCSPSSVSEISLDGQAGGGDWIGSDITAGTEFGIFGDSSTDLETTTVRIVWVDPSGGRTAILGEWTGPDA